MCTLTSRLYLNSLTEACAQQREEDSCDGYVVSWLGKTCVFATHVHRHAPWDVSNRYLVTLCNTRQNL